MAELVGELGFARTTIALVLARAKVSPRTFYQEFRGLEECFLAVMDDEAESAIRLLEDSFALADDWRDGLRFGLASMLVHLESEPPRARVWLIEALAAGPRALEHRERHLTSIRSLIVASWPLPDGWEPPPLAAEGVVASIIGVLHAHVVSASPEPMISLLPALTGLVMSPYLPRDHVRSEIGRACDLAEAIQRGSPVPSVQPHATELPPLLADPVAHRARACVRFIARRPGASNRQVAAGVGVRHQGQIAALLARLERLAVVSKVAGAPGHPNAWRLTSEGRRVLAALER
jgi:AcrR family transcriptional regulator